MSYLTPTTHVESINRQSVPDNAKSISLRPLIEHFYLEAYTVSVQDVQQKLQKRSSLGIFEVLVGKKAIGRRISLNFLMMKTTWFKGTVIAYSCRGYVVTFARGK